jgi:hypothetical protein
MGLLKPILRSVPFLVFLLLLAPILQSTRAFYEPAPFPLPCLPQADNQTGNQSLSEDSCYRIATIEALSRPVRINPTETKARPGALKVKNIQILITGSSPRDASVEAPPRPAVIPAVYYKPVKGSMTEQRRRYVQDEGVSD